MNTSDKFNDYINSHLMNTFVASDILAMWRSSHITIMFLLGRIFRCRDGCYLGSE